MHGPVFLPVSVNAIQYMAIGMSATGRVQNHAVILFKEARGSLRVLELTVNPDWTANIAARDHVPEDKFAWAVPRFHPRILKTFARDCQSIATSPQRVRYGFKCCGFTTLVTKGTQLSLVGAIGLTCATFVMAMFHRHKHPLIEIGEWSSDATDAQWQHSFADRIERDIGLLGRPATSEEQQYMQANRSDIPCTCFRPEDVVASCRCSAHPSKFTETREAANEISSWIRANP